MPIKRWNLRERDEARAAAPKLEQELSLPPLVARVMAARGYDTKEKLDGFLSPAERLSDPMHLRDMDKAVERVRMAIRGGERVAVYGDYDCDGIMSTVVLYSYLESAGCDVCYYIPHRDREGYGLNRDALKLIYDDGVSLVITVDNGITALGEAEYASSIGLDLVITDHHQPRDVIPDAVAVVDPHRLDDESGCEYLAGVGVTFKLICALEGGDDELMLDQYGDLVAVATIADIVPLTGENRVIVKRGLAMLRETENAGLAALLRVCKLEDKALTCENVAYGIVPRINSAGRFDCVDSAVELFISEDGEDGELDTIAADINALNDKRRLIEDEIVADIMRGLDGNHEVIDRRVIVLSGENWHHGIVGIVASRMVERFGKPCIVLSSEGETARGSGRSVKGFSIIDAIDAVSGNLERYGGHNQAAGLTVKTGLIDTFTREINEWAAEHYPEMPQQTINIDCELLPSELAIEQIQPLSMLEPFGTGNEPLVFALRGCVIQGIYPIGEGKHLRLRMFGGGTVFYAVYFGVTQKNFPYVVGETVDAAASVEVNEWNGELRVSVKLKDLHLTGLDYEQIYHSEQLYRRLTSGETVEAEMREQAVPTRDDIAVVYRYLRSKKRLNVPGEVIYAKLSGSISCLCKLKIALDVLDEMQLITRASEGGLEELSVVENPEQVDISKSKILLGLKC